MEKNCNWILTSIAVCVVLILISGCEPENKIDARQERLYSAENLELKKQIDGLEKKYEKDMAAKEAELNKCVQQNERLSKQISDDALKMFENDVMSSLMEQVQQLSQENTELKAKIEQLEKAQAEPVD